MMKIAVFVNESGLSTEPSNATSVTIYEKHSNQWTVTQSHKVSISTPQTLSSVRAFLNEMINQLNDCKIIVASKMLGATYNILDRAGFQLWEFQGNPIEFLPIIEQKEIIQNYELEPESNPFAYFEDLGDQRYSINIKKILFNDPTLTSKKLLLPFLDHMDFYELEVIFSHLPPWLDIGLKKRNLVRDLIDHHIDEHKILITKGACTD